MGINPQRLRGLGHKLRDANFTRRAYGVGVKARLLEEWAVRS